MRLALALALAAVALGVTADLAAAQSDKGVLSMTPARRALTARPPVDLGATRISNSTRLDMRVTVFPALLTQELDGSFGFRETRRELNAARMIFPVEPRGFTLRPGQERDLRLRWALLPRKAKAAYMGLVVQGVPVAEGRGVGSILRLLGINFFKLPGRWSIEGRLTGLRGEQAEPRVLRFFPRVRNTGEIHEQPRGGNCSVAERGRGVRIRRLPFGRGVILPGYEREYPVLIRRPNVLPAGSYRMTCVTRFGDRRSTRTMDFRLSGPNTLPTAELRLRSIGASGEVGEAADVRAAIRNAGSKASRAALRVRIDRIPVGGAPVLAARGRFDQGTIGAGDTKDAEVSLGKLVAGNYRVTVTLTDGRTALDEKTADFTASPARGFFQEIIDWLKDNLPWLIALLAILLILFLIWRQRKKQRELEEQLAEARHGYVPAAPPAAAARPPATKPPPPPATPHPPPAHSEPEPSPPAVAAGSSDGRVSLNTAGIEELMTLPGVGRRAAERIVAHRDANGPFGSLDELSAIEGFHAERIARISGSASV